MKEKIKIMQDSKEIECDLLFTVNDEKKGIKYIICTDNKEDENGNAKVYLARYEGNKIVSISDKEKKVLEEIVNLVQKEVCRNEG